MKQVFLIAALTALTGSTPALHAQVRLELRPVEPLTLPMSVDSNSPSFWRGDHLHVFSSVGAPVISTFDQEFNLTAAGEVSADRLNHLPMWIESVWEDGDGTLYAWYHYERLNVCPGWTLTAPEIGALVSHDGGVSFEDLGIVLSSGESPDCSSQNGYFAGGHGDFSVIPDRDRQYFYFLFGAYGGDVVNQGVGIARMSFAHLRSPVGAVWKYFEGGWSEPGLGGRVTPVFPANVAWQQANADSFWGSSVHWNTYLQLYVVLLNRSCCAPGWPQEGIYVSMNADLHDPEGWSLPVKILDGGDWYPWVMGVGERETSSEAGQLVRLFVRDTSEWEIVFHSDAGAEQAAQAGAAPQDEPSQPGAAAGGNASIP